VAKNKKSMQNIISVSRRTDIPAFYTDWFVRRLKERCVFVRHPYTKEIFYVSLKPEDILGIVFWSKNFSPLLSRIDDIERVTKNLFFHFTITGISKEIEVNTPSYKEAIEDLIFIAERYSPDNIIWRFDPICITDKISFQEHIESFMRCAGRLKGYVYTCYISFVNPYYKVVKNFQKYTTHKLLNISVEEKKTSASQLAPLARQYGIKLYACCNDYLLSTPCVSPPLTGDPKSSPPLMGGDRGEGEAGRDDFSRPFSGSIQKASCINLNYLSGIWGLEGIDYEKPSPTRKECACTKSIDIGAYDTCPHGCIYCYANTDKEKAMSFYKDFNPDWDALDGDVEEYVPTKVGSHKQMVV
jgi:hypothetical protein